LINNSRFKEEQQMYAVIEVGAKQYSVKKDDVIEVEKLVAEKGAEITLGKVLLFSDDKRIEVGQPYLKNAVVKAEVLRQLKGEKVISYKYRRRKSSDWKKGHRQKLTSLKIRTISLK
jgi:large subunit ribosomal protein L21